MTTTVREELAKIASSCEEALTDQARLEGFLARDFKAIDRFIKGLDAQRGNAAITVEEARDLAMQLRQAISWNEVNAQGTHMLFLLVFQMSLLAQQDADLQIDVSANMEAFGSWFKLWEKARSAWEGYTEDEPPGTSA